MRYELNSTASALKGDRAEGPADQTRQKTHAMVKAGGALPRPCVCVTDRERPGKDGHVFLELWTTHCYCCCYYRVATQHTTAQLHKRSELQGKGDEPAKNKEKTLPRSHRNCYLVIPTDVDVQIQGVVLMQSGKKGTECVWGAESRRSTPCETTDKCM